MIVLPMFLLMGVLAGDCGIAEGAYFAVSKWAGKVRGSLLYATVVANALFGACSGSGASASAVFTKIALPEIKRYGYDLSLSLGAIAGASGLALIIPPSIGIVFFCLLTNVSIGRRTSSRYFTGYNDGNAHVSSHNRDRNFKAVFDACFRRWGELEKQVFIANKGLAYSIPLCIGDRWDVCWSFSSFCRRAIGAAGVILYGLAFRVHYERWAIVSGTRLYYLEIFFLFLVAMCSLE